MPDEETPVLIVGGNLTGLCASVFLSWQGIPTILVERHQGVLEHPRAASVTPRVMEIFRGMGLEDAIRKAVKPSAPYADILQAESLAGRQLNWFTGTFPAGDDGISPAGWALCGQDRLERLLRDQSRTLGGDIRNGYEVSALRQDQDGVTAFVTDRASGRKQVVRADYVIAADGNRSPIREGLGIPSTGRGMLGHIFVILFQCDLTSIKPERPFFICFVTNPEVHGALGELDPAGQQWSLAIPFPAGAAAPLPEDYPDEHCRRLVRAAIGVPEKDMRITARRYWQIAERRATRFQDGRIFLVGDAAHVCPPTGGFSTSLGVEDTHNLAWKLAHRLRGWAGPALLDTYTEEREPVAAFTANQAVLRHLRNNDLDGQEPEQLVTDASVIFGAVYRSRAVIPDDAPGGRLPVRDPRIPGGPPGTRMRWLPFRHRGREISAHDLTGRRFVLLSGADGGAWHSAAGTAFRRLGIPARSYRVGPAGDLVDVHDRWVSDLALSHSGAVLIRPDGYVCWRTRALTDEPVRTLTDVLAGVLDRREHPGQPRAPGESSAPRAAASGMFARAGRSHSSS